MACGDWKAFLAAHPQQCAPCSLTPVIGYYNAALKAAGRKDLADGFKKFETEEPTGDAIAAMLDGIRAQAQGTLRSDLEEIDCGTQDILLSL